MPLVALILGALGPILLWRLTRRMERQASLVVWVLGWIAYDAVVSHLMAPYTSGWWVVLGSILGCIVVNATDGAEF